MKCYFYCGLLLPQHVVHVNQVFGEFRNSAPVYRSRYFYDINISQGSEATRLRCCGITTNRFTVKFTTKCASKRTLKIGQNLVKLGQKLGVVLF